MFREDRDKLIEESKTELETFKKNLDSEHEMKRNREVRRSVEQTQLSANDRIYELTERIRVLERELEDMEKMVNSEVEYVFKILLNRPNNSQIALWSYLMLILSSPYQNCKETKKPGLANFT